MNQLIIVAHPKKDSFSKTISEELKSRFLNESYSVKIRDLYQIEFNPLLTAKELKINKTGDIYPDIIEEQRMMAWADEITFIYPLWWNAFPAVLKGYIDRVFTNGFAFRIGEKGPEGLLGGKRVRLITTAGMSDEALKKSNIYEGLRITQEHGVFEFCDMEVVMHEFIPRVTALTEEEKQEVLDGLIQKIFDKKEVDA